MAIANRSGGCGKPALYSGANTNQLAQPMRINRCQFVLPFEMINLRNIICLFMLLASLASTGCMRRRMTIVSSPPGAMVYVDDQPIGVTPVSTSYTYYGTRKFQLVKGGYETITELRTISAPWYEMPPLDLVTENFAGREIRDEREIRFEMTPQQVISPEQLTAQAKELRARSKAGVPAVAPTSGGVYTPPPAMLNPNARP